MAKRNEIKMPTNPDVQYMQSWCTNFLRKGFGKNVILVPANKPKPAPGPGPVPPIFRINANPIYQQPLSTRRSRANPLKQLIPVPIPVQRSQRISSQNPLLLNSSGTPSPAQAPAPIRTSTSTSTSRRRSQRISSQNPLLLNSSGTASPAQAPSPPRTSSSRRRMLRTNSNPVRTPS
jgi:hypothetical protein